MAISLTAVEAVDLVKTYSGGRGKPPVRALAGLSFQADPGTIFALLGPNGAGKSTAMKILATLTRPDSGTATVAGIDVCRQPDQVRRAIGLVAQKSVCDPGATGLENLVLAGRLHGLDRRAARARADQLLDRFSLTDAGRRLVRTYSGGMARKLDVALGLMHRPAVLFLDEPTTGLDPEARADLWAELEAMADAEQMTVLLTTHYLDEADHLADRLAIVNDGAVVVAGAPDELKSGLRGDAVIVELTSVHDVAPAVAAVSRTAGLREAQEDGLTVRARADHGATALPALFAALGDSGIPVRAATVARPSLDDVYLRHTGRTLGSEVAA